MVRIHKIFGLMAGACLLAAACSPRIYRPPALGAEYRFDEGLKTKGHQAQHLFDPKMRDYLQKKGMQQKTTSPPAAAHRDSTRAQGIDSLTNRTPQGSPASTDSSHNAP